MVSQVSDEVAARIRARAAAEQKAQHDKKANSAQQQPPQKTQQIEKGQPRAGAPPAAAESARPDAGPSIFRTGPPAGTPPSGSPSSADSSPRSAAVIIQKTNSAGSSEPEEGEGPSSVGTAPSKSFEDTPPSADGDVIEAASLLRSFNTHRWPTPKKTPSPCGAAANPASAAGSSGSRLRNAAPGAAAGSRSGKNTLDMLFNVTTRLGDLSECSEEKFNRLRERAAKMASSAHHELPRGITQRPSQKWVSR